MEFLLSIDFSSVAYEFHFTKKKREEMYRIWYILKSGKSYLKPILREGIRSLPVHYIEKDELWGTKGSKVFFLLPVLKENVLNRNGQCQNLKGASE